MSNGHSVENVISYIVNANCRLPLALERYNKEFGTNLSQEEMVALVFNDPSMLFGQLKVSLTLKLFNNMMQTQMALEASLSELKPSELSRLYVGQVTAFGTLTNKPVDDSKEEPTDFIAAKRTLIDRVASYKKRKSGESTDEAVNE